MWVFEIFNHFKFKIMVAISVLLLIALLCFVFLWQKERTNTQMAILDASNVRASVVGSLLDREKQIRELVAANNQLTLDAQIALNKAHTLHKEQLREIEANSRSLSVLNNRLHNDIETLNRELSTYSRTTVETYATTAGNNLAECSKTVTELERLSREYNSEIEFLRNSWPKSNQPHKPIDDP